MLRAVLLGLLCLSAVNCKSQDATVKAQAGVAAGTVTQVAGTVTLHHGDAARPLAKGDTVEGDDIVETGADGSVVIELAHNHVTWELGANKKSKVRESLAWTQPKKETSAKAVDEDSAAAGRHAERSAADTSVSGGAKADVAAPPAEIEAEKQERADVAAAGEDKEDKKVAEPVRKKAPSKSEPAPAPKSPAPRAEPQAAMAATESMPAPPPPPPPPKTTAPPPKVIAKAAPPTAPQSGSAPGAANDMGGLGLSGTGEGGGGGGNGAGIASIGTIGHGAGDPNAAAFDLLTTKQSELQACFADKKMDVKLTIHVDVHGKATLKLSKTVPAAAKTCMTKVVGTLKFAPKPATATLELK